MSESKEDKQEKLDWMYQGPAGHVSREEYLLGRKVDASLDILNRTEAGEDPQEAPPAQAIEHEVAPQRYTARRPEDDDPNAPQVQVDMRRKLMEDPLLEIRKKEQKTKAEITSNPVKMAQLKLLIESIQSSDKKKKKKSKKSKKKSSKKSKKSKKRKRKDSSSSSSSDSDSDSDDEPKKKAKKSRDDEVSKHRHSEDERLRRLHDDHRDNRRDDEHRDRDRRQYDDHRDRDNRHYNEHRDRDTRKYDNHRDGDRSAHDRYTSSREGKTNDKDSYRNTASVKAPEFKRDRTTGSKLSEEEKERRRQQMMQMADDRDVQRKSNVERYKQERIAEEKEENSHARKMIQKHMNATDVSIEDRIKSRKSTYQRGSDAMSKNFARK